MHQLFLTLRAVYLLVFDASKHLDLDTDVDPWLDAIQAKSPGARFILIATHVDECSKEVLDERCSDFANHIVRRLDSMLKIISYSPRVQRIDLFNPPRMGILAGPC